MKNSLLILLTVVTVCLSACGGFDGSVYVRNTHGDNYRVYINNANKGTVGPNGTTGKFFYPDGTELTVYALQLDGYLLYPSEYYSTGTIKAGQAITVAF